MRAKKKNEEAAVEEKKNTFVVESGERNFM
jgi:hypothetical protein